MSRIRGIARIRRGIWISGLVVRQWLHVARSVKTTFEAESKRKVRKEEKILWRLLLWWCFALPNKTKKMIVSSTGSHDNV